MQAKISSRFVCRTDNILGYLEVLNHVDTESVLATGIRYFHIPGCGTDGAPGNISDTCQQHLGLATSNMGVRSLVLISGKQTIYTM